MASYRSNGKTKTKPKHHPELCGLPALDHPPLCPACRAEQQELGRPAPGQPGTFSEQLRIIFGPAGAPEWTGLAGLCPSAPRETDEQPPAIRTILPAIRKMLQAMIDKTIDSEVPELVRHLICKEKACRNGQY
jgi:hypothetical protein